MIGALERHETARVPGGSEDLARVRDADGVVRGRMHDEQRSFQRADALAQIGGADVLDEVPFEGQRLAPDEERRFALGVDPLAQGVVVVLDMGGLDTARRC